MKREELLKWFNEELLPGLVESGRFRQEDGEKETVEKCEFEAIEMGTSSFASFPSYAKLTLRTAAGCLTHDILVKFQCQDPMFREKMRTVRQYKNEVTMYNEVLPGFVEFLKRCGHDGKLLEKVVPKCYFASHDEGNPEKSIVILGDLRTEGYRTSESVTDLDLKHCLLSLERLAQFHSLSFAMKFRNWEPFEKLKKSFVHVWFSNDPETKQGMEDFKLYCAQRGIDYLLSKEDSEVPREYLENFRKLIEPIFDLLISLYSPREPLSVICHGDFNRNNILYKYTDGVAANAKLIDFQTFLYGSPCLDLSFFIYMNTSLEFRDRHFDDLLAHYHSTLIKTTAHILKEEEEAVRRRIPLEALKEEFSKVAVSAYLIVAFFLPVMMTPPQKDFEENIIGKTYQEMAEENYKLGGDVVSQKVAEVIVDFYRRKFYT